MPNPPKNLVDGHRGKPSWRPVSPAKVMAPVLPAAPSGDPKIDLILKRLVAIEAKLNDLHDHISHMEAKHTDRIIEAIGEVL